MSEPNLPAPAPHDIRMQWGVKIPLRDGVRLNATLYLPRDHEKSSPVIFTLTPYIGQTYHSFALSFAQHGYPSLCLSRKAICFAICCFDPLNDGPRGG